ncbi:CKLF-like MARVEL transmembrane domain-containing protein 6 [Mantella aurantiaca]
MNEAAYQPTTEPINKTPDHSKVHLSLKVCQLLFSLVAFICEEIITQCETCSGLYIFEFVSCSAFLISILMFVVYYTPLRKKINIPSFNIVDFWITLVVGVLLFIASIVFIATIEKSSLAGTSVAFGFLASLAFLAEVYFMWKSNYLQKKEKPKTTPNVNGQAEGQPLNSPVQET